MFLGEVAKLRIGTIGFIMSVSLYVRLSVCPSVRPFVRPSVCPYRTTPLSLDDFHEISYLSIFQKSVENIQVPLKSDNNNGYFTCNSVYVRDNIALNSS